MLSNNVINFLRFFALERSEMLLFLPPDSENVYETSDTAEQILFGAEALMRAACKQIHDDSTHPPNDLREILLEILCVSTMMLDLSEQADYFWLFDKTSCPISGPYDDGWNVLRRLAALALNCAELDLCPPTVSFEELLLTVGIKTTRRKNSESED